MVHCRGKKEVKVCLLTQGKTRQKTRFGLDCGVKKKKIRKKIRRQVGGTEAKAGKERGGRGREGNAGDRKDARQEGHSGWVDGKGVVGGRQVGGGVQPTML